MEHSGGKLSNKENIRCRLRSKPASLVSDIYNYNIT